MNTGTPSATDDGMRAGCELDYVQQLLERCRLHAAVVTDIPGEFATGRSPHSGRLGPRPPTGGRCARVPRTGGRVDSRDRGGQGVVRRRGRTRAAPSRSVPLAPRCADFDLTVHDPELFLYGTCAVSLPTSSRRPSPTPEPLVGEAVYPIAAGRPARIGISHAEG
jgi:hypothetical protein